MTLCVDEDPRATDLTKSPRAVVCFGLARLVEDEERVRAGTQKVEDRYLPGAEGPELEELLWFEGRTVVEIEPCAGSPGIRASNRRKSGPLRGP